MLCNKIKFIVLLALFVICCKNHSANDKITIHGNIENLPDGKLYLYERAEKIDSIDTKNGKFIFNLAKEDNFEPKYIQFVHVAYKDSTRRAFMFNTRAKYKSKPINTDRIMLEEDFPELLGKIEDSEYGPKLKSSQFIAKQEFGPQSKVFFEDTIMFPTPYTTKHLNEMVNAYPFSYHVLFQFERFVHSWSNEQALAFFARFDSKLRNGPTGKRIEAYIKSRDSKKMSEVSLPDSNKIHRKILIPTKRMHLVILWASWCGPCRKEIPGLKRIYQKFENLNKIEMTSISLDEKNENWKTALKYEKMPWRQLIINQETSIYSKELFSFDGTIPATLLIDSEGKIIKMYTGFDEGNEADIVRLINSYNIIK